MTLDESVFDSEALVRRDRMTADAIVDALLVRVCAQIEHVHRATPCSTEPWPCVTCRISTKYQAPTWMEGILTSAVIADSHRVEYMVFLLPFNSAGRVYEPGETRVYTLAVRWSGELVVESPRWTDDENREWEHWE